MYIFSSNLIDPFLLFFLDPFAPVGRPAITYTHVLDLMTAGSWQSRGGDHGTRMHWGWLFG